MVDVKKKIMRSYGSIENFVDMMSIHFRAGMNVLPMLRKWEESVEWRHGKGEPRGFFPGTVWLCYDERTDRLFIRFHEGAKPEQTLERVVRISDTNTRKITEIDIASKEARLKTMFEKALK